MTIMQSEPRMRATGRDVRTLLAGKAHPSLRITRQAYRVHESDTDEIIQLTSGRDYWVGGRLGAQFTIWACQNRDAADDKFEQLTAGSDWMQARPRALEAT